MAELARRLILRTVIPSQRGFVARELEDDDVLILRTFQNLVTAANGKKFYWVLF
jgi:hypothetical protein